jgi:hypothetical protein
MGRHFGNWLGRKLSGDISPTWENWHEHLADRSMELAPTRKDWSFWADNPMEDIHIMDNQPTWRDVSSRSFELAPTRYCFCGDPNCQYN